MRVWSLFSAILIVSSSLCAFAQAKDTSADEVVLRYKKSLLWAESVSMRIRSNVDIDDTDTGKEFYSLKRDFVFRRDADRAEWAGQSLLFDAKGDLDRINSSVIKQISTGKFYLDLVGTSPFAASPRAAVMKSDYREAVKYDTENPDLGGPLLGKLQGTKHKGIAELLGEADDLRMRDMQERLNGVPCYVLEGTTEHGKVTAWIAPEKGYNALKWVVERSAGSIFDDSPLSSKWPEVESATVVLDLVEMRQVGNVSAVFVPKSSRYTDTVRFRNNTKSVTQHKYEVSDVQSKPDFDALGAFKIDLPDGTRIITEDFVGVKYIWMNGGLVSNVDKYVIEEIDQVTDGIMAEGSAPASLASTKTGRAAPNEPHIPTDKESGLLTDAVGTRPEVMSRSRPLLLLVLILIGLSIIGIVVWRMFRGRSG